MPERSVLYCLLSHESCPAGSLVLLSRISSLSVVLFSTIYHFLLLRSRLLPFLHSTPMLPWNRFGRLAVLSKSTFPSAGRWVRMASGTDRSGEAGNHAEKEQPADSASASKDDASSSSSSAGAYKEAELLDAIKNLEAKLKQCEEKYLFSLAEAENVRFRARRDVDNAKSFGISNFAKSLLEVSDNLQRAVDSAPADQRNSSLFTGVELTRRELMKSFDQHGILKFESLKQKFNPDLHQALFETPPDTSKGLEPGLVAVVVKEGYTLGGRVLRPAQVGVVMGEVSSK